MKSLFKSALLLLSFFLASCSFNSTETFVISEINLYDSTEENEKIGNDLISYPYSQMIAKDLQITDNEVLKNIRWEYWVASESKKVSFRIILNNNAKNYKDKLVPFFENFVINKLSEYKTRKEYLEGVTNKANELIDLTNTNQYDSIWKQGAPTLVKMVTKDQFYEILEKRKATFKPQGEKKLRNRLVFSDLGDGIKGEFYIINYEYDSKETEQITLERIDNELKILGYRYFIPNN